MKIKAGTTLLINHQRKGIFKAKAVQDIDTEKDNWYRVAATEAMIGKVHAWQPGEVMTCRKDLCTVIIEREGNDND